MFEVLRNLAHRASRTIRKTKARSRISLLRGAFTDWRRFSRYSGLRGQDRGSSYFAQMVMLAHKLEKGLALPEPKEWFGKDAVERLVEALEAVPQSQRSPQASHAEQMSLGVLREYFDRFGPTAASTGPPDWGRAAQERLRKIEDTRSAENLALGGTIPYALPRCIDIQDYTAFVCGRSSLRHFADEAVGDDLLHEAVRLAANSPSVCNRQGSMCRIFPRGPRADSLLRHQNGNAGFGHTASHVMLVTYDLSVLLNAGERNQSFVDGGMYAMTLLYSLQALGIGSCPLNWSASAGQDAGLRAEIDLPNNEVVIMMIAVGYPPTGDIRAASSPIRPDRLAVVPPVRGTPGVDGEAPWTGV